MKNVGLFLMMFVIGILTCYGQEPKEPVIDWLERLDRELQESRDLIQKNTLEFEADKKIWNEKIATLEKDNAKLKEEIEQAKKTIEEIINNKLKELKNDLETKIANLETLLTTKINQEIGSLKTRISNVEKSLTDKLNDENNKLTEKINEAESRLGNAISAVANSLGKKISEVSEELTRKIESLEITAKKDLKELEKQFTEKLKIVSESILQIVTYNNIKKQIEELEIKEPKDENIIPEEYDDFVKQGNELEKKYLIIKKDIEQYHQDYNHINGYQPSKTLGKALENKREQKNNLLLEKLKVFALPINIWSNCCYKQGNEYILDMTTETWQKLPCQEQIQYAKMYQTGYAKAKKLEVRVVYKVWNTEYAMKLVPPGVYYIGSPSNEANRQDNEKQTKITIVKGFYVGETEVTQAQWEAVMGGNPSNWKDSGNLPVERISWTDAIKFASEMNRKTNLQGFRLLSEIEWEYACRAGTTTAYNIGSTISTNIIAYSCGRTVSCGSLNNQNAWGLYDMHGNVWEWCLDEWGKGYTETIHNPESISINQFQNVSSGVRVVRGGFWNCFALYCRSAYRGCRHSLSCNDVGCRLSRVLP